MQCYEEGIPERHERAGSMRLRLRQLEALHKVAEVGSITRAADELGVSQPAVSRLISDLSEQLGFKIFQRRNNLLVPTQEARFLLPDIDRLLARLDHIGELSQNLTARKAGHLKIACLPGFATSHLPGVLASFLNERPAVTVTVEPDRPERILEWMLNEQYDLGITDGFEGHPAVHHKTMNVRTVCIFPMGHRLSTKKTISVSDLDGEKFIHTRKDSHFYRDLHNAFAAKQIEMDSIVEVRQFTSACEFVAKGVGVSVISELDAIGYSGRGIDSRRFEPIVPHRLSLLQPVHKEPSLITLEFLDLFRKSLKPFEV